jgi:hypothetical protein
MRHVSRRLTRPWLPTLALTTLLVAMPSAATAQPAAAAGAVDASGTAAAPAELAPYGKGWRVQGNGMLRFYGFKVYDASLWLTGSETSMSFTRPFALDIRYATSVKGRDIANTSLIEMQRISSSSPEQIQAWGQLLNTVFVDVKSGDRIIGVHLPREGVRFFLNGKLLAETSDAAFSEAFFKIWLDPKTKRPELRQALLGLPTS